ATCNGSHLAALEREVEAAFAGGFDALRAVDELRLFQWMTKIHYGILFKELSLYVDRKNPELGSIINTDVLEEYQSLHAMLQSVRLPFDFASPTPWSVFVVRTHSYPGTDYDFDYHDGFIQPTFAIRCGGVGLFAHLMDNGTQAAVTQDFWRQIHTMTLHPLQWEEIWVNVNDLANRMDRMPKGMVYVPDEERLGEVPVQVSCMPIGGLSSKPVYLPEDRQARAEMLVELWNRHGLNLTLEKVFFPPRNIWTMVWREDGTPNHLDANGQRVDSPGVA
ncbi:MAG: hypothetical protein U1E29_07790, partial [Coriobacteriia bacterium]|nr:hypothetical protein [Coriobacteriia bacterium]